MNNKFIKENITKKAQNINKICYRHNKNKKI